MALETPIFADAHATTPVAPEVVAAMQPFWSTHFANPASVHYARGRGASRAVEQARAALASLVDCADPAALIWTSGATEANNAILQAMTRGARGPRRRLITVATEHASVLDPARQWAAQGWPLTVLPVAPAGLLDMASLQAALDTDVVLVSVMHCNNEIGVIQDLQRIAALTHQAGAWLHSDVAQGLGLTPFSLRDSGVDFASFSAHKIYGPKGVGALYARPGRARQALQPWAYGGGQEGGLRAGTLNVPAIVGFGAAAQLMQARGKQDAAHLRAQRDALEAELCRRIDALQINGAVHPGQRHPGNLHISLPGANPGVLWQHLRPIEVSATSACHSRQAGGASHVLRALGLSDETARASLRIGLCRDVSARQIETLADVITAAATQARA
ncbi:MAG: cysteine desulfurase family protein [Polyangiales bacterium]